MESWNLISKSFYQNEDPLFLGEQLLGCIIKTQINNQITAARIVELEIYKAPEDKGSHAFDNKRTGRTETMFKEGGIAYVYLCYGIHHMFNIVSGPEEMAHAILIRATEPIDGQALMETRRKIKNPIPALTNGPGKLSNALGIRTSMDGVKLYDPQSPISIWSDGQYNDAGNIIKSPRVGIAYAEECAHWPWRFYLENNSWVSKPLIVTYPSSQSSK